MRPVKAKPRYRCDFCSRTSSYVKGMAEHEQRCWRNPNRVCQSCDSTGFYWEDGCQIPCHYCAQFDPQIAERAAP